MEAKKVKIIAMVKSIELEIENCDDEALKASLNETLMKIQKVIDDSDVPVSSGGGDQQLAISAKHHQQVQAQARAQAMIGELRCGGCLGPPGLTIACKKCRKECKSQTPTVFCR